MMYKIAAAQLAPAYLDLEGCLQKAEHWIAEAGKQGVHLLVFPETWLPGYPVWIDTAPEAARWDYPPVKAVFRRLFENSPEIPSPATDRLCAAARQAGLTVIMGLNEREGGTLYNSMLYISGNGEILGKHRKLIPTYTERMIWGRGDGRTLTVVETPLGKVGGLVCWEHWMPLARQAMHEKREVVHAAMWPTVSDIHLVASRSYAFEGRCFVVAVGTPLRRGDLPAGFSLLDQMEGDQWMFGGSAIIGPNGKILAGPAGEDDTLVIAEIDPAQVAEELMTLDVTGHYARPDVFRLIVLPENLD
jgi:predicted amidohydrolase